MCDSVFLKILIFCFIQIVFVSEHNSRQQSRSLAAHTALRLRQIYGFQICQTFQHIKDPRRSFQPPQVIRLRVHRHVNSSGPKIPRIIESSGISRLRGTVYDASHRHAPSGQTADPADLLHAALHRHLQFLTSAASFSGFLLFPERPGFRSLSGRPIPCIFSGHSVSRRNSIHDENRPVLPVRRSGKDAAAHCDILSLQSGKDGDIPVRPFVPQSSGQKTQREQNNGKTPPFHGGRRTKNGRCVILLIACAVFHSPLKFIFYFLIFNFFT